MGRTFIRQETQIRNSDAYTDNLSSGQATLETASTHIEYDLNALRSQVNRIVDATLGGNWYDNVPTVNSKLRGLLQLNTDLDDIEEHKILCGVQVLTDVSVPAAVQASETLDATGGNFADAETVTIGTTVYTMESIFSDTAYKVLIGGTASDSLDNLIAAINNAAGEGTTYGTGTAAHPDVTAAAGAGDTMDVTAILAGTVGNAIALAETSTNVVWTGGATFLSGGAGDVVVLSDAGLETPTDTAGVGATGVGAAVKVLTGDVGNHSLAEESSSNPLAPYNVVVIRDASTKDAIISGGMEVFGLIQAESGVVQGDNFNDTDKQVQISFVRNDGSDDLEAVPAADIAGMDIEYMYAKRCTLDTLPQNCAWPPHFIDQTSILDITRQLAYDNQGTTPVELATDADLDLALTKQWFIRDALNADLFGVKEATGTSASEVQIGAATDVFNVDAILNDFASGISVASGGAKLDVGVTAGTINSDTGEDLTLLGTQELWFDDGNRTGSTWASPMKLTDTQAEWDDLETEFGAEYSLAKMLLLCKKTVSDRGKTYAVVTADITIGNDMGGVGGGVNLDAQLPDMSKGDSFVDDYDVYLNGDLMRPHATTNTHDYYPGTSLANGQLKWSFKIKATDVVCVIPYDRT